MAAGDDQSVIRRIIESNPLLESFGNAKTIRNARRDCNLETGPSSGGAAPQRRLAHGYEPAEGVSRAQV